MQRKRAGRALLQPLPPELRSRCDEIRGHLLELGPRDITVRYRIGALVRDAQEKPGTYGDNTVQQIGKVLGYGVKTLYAYAIVASGFNSSELSGLVKQQRASGLPLRWPHIAILSAVESARRAELVQRVLDERFLPSALRRLVKDEPKRAPRALELADDVMVRRRLPPLRETSFPRSAPPRKRGGSRVLAPGPRFVRNLSVNTPRLVQTGFLGNRSDRDLG